MSTALRQALSGLSTAMRDTAHWDAADLLNLGALVSQLYDQLLRPGEHTEDPRYALALAELTETGAHQALRAQVYAAHLIEATAAHALRAEELSTLRTAAPDFATPPRLAEGRPSYKSPADLLAAWLRLDYFEAARRVEDAHHVIAQFDYQHNRCSAQFPRMADRFHTRLGVTRPRLSPRPDACTNLNRRSTNFAPPPPRRR